MHDEDYLNLIRRAADLRARSARERAHARVLIVQSAELAVDVAETHEALWRAGARADPRIAGDDLTTLWTRR